MNEPETNPTASPVANNFILGPVVLTITKEHVEIWRGRTTAGAMACVEPDELSRFENEDGPQAPEPASFLPASRNHLMWFLKMPFEGDVRCNALTESKS